MDDWPTDIAYPKEVGLSLRYPPVFAGVIVESMNKSAPHRGARARAILLRLRQIEHRVRGKKIEWADLEVMPHRWHHRPILDAWHMMEAKRVPSHDVGIFDIPICVRPDRQSIVSFAARRIQACRVAFGSIIGSHPELVPGKCAEFLGRIVRREQRLRSGSRHDFIPGRI